MPFPPWSRCRGAPILNPIPFSLVHRVKNQIQVTDSEMDRMTAESSMSQPPWRRCFWRFDRRLACGSTAHVFALLAVPSGVGITLPWLTWVAWEAFCGGSRAVAFWLNGGTRWVSATAVGVCFDRQVMWRGVVVQHSWHQWWLAVSWRDQRSVVPSTLIQRGSSPILPFFAELDSLFPSWGFGGLWGHVGLCGWHVGQR